MWTRTDIDPRAGHTVVIVFFELYLSFTLIKWDELVCDIYGRSNGEKAF